jgi:hypothetical protein
VPPLPETQAVSDIIRTTLGPRSMLKMILDASGGTCRPARAIARRPRGDRGHSRFKPNGAEKSKRSFRFDFSFLDAMLTFSLFRSTDLFAFD